MRCRILYVVGQLGLGGLERQLSYLLRAMDRSRYLPAVVVWNFSQNDAYVSRIQELNVPFYNISTQSSKVTKLREFRRLARQLSPEVVHSYSFYTNFAAWYAALGSDAIPIGSIRRDFVTERPAAGRILGSLSAYLPPSHICNSHAAKNTIESSSFVLRSAPLALVRNRLDIHQFVPKPLPQQRVTLLAVGSLYQEKRWDRLLNCIAALASRGLEFTVRHAGEGPLKTSLQDQAKHLGIDHLVEFMGLQNDIFPLFRDSTFLVHTADAEGSPNVVMEAMACGRAVVATDAGDVPYLVDDGITGFVVDRGDSVALVDRMARLITEPDLCNRMGQAGRRKAEREFGLDRLVSETLDAYRAFGWRDA